MHNLFKEAARLFKGEAAYVKCEIKIKCLFAVYVSIVYGSLMPTHGWTRMSSSVSPSTGLNKFSSSAMSLAASVSQSTHNQVVVHCLENTGVVLSPSHHSSASDQGVTPGSYLWGGGHTWLQVLYIGTNMFSCPVWWLAIMLCLLI